MERTNHLGGVRWPRSVRKSKLMGGAGKFWGWREKVFGVARKSLGGGREEVWGWREEVWGWREKVLGVARESFEGGERKFSGWREKCMGGGERTFSGWREKFIGGNERTYSGWREKVFGVARESIGGGERTLLGVTRERIQGGERKYLGWREKVFGVARESIGGGERTLLGVARDSFGVGERRVCTSGPPYPRTPHRINQGEVPDLHLIGFNLLPQPLWKSCSLFFYVYFSPSLSCTILKLLRPLILLILTSVCHTYFRTKYSLFWRNFLLLGKKNFLGPDMCFFRSKYRLSLFTRLSLLVVLV